MEELKEKLQGHLLICTNKKETGECCFPKGGEEIQKTLKAWIKSNPTLDGKVKVSKSGCLGHCTKGIAAVLYPSQHWFVRLGAQDVEDLKSRLLACLK